MKTGFTLIELLVVVLIIGILSAVALPQYQTAVAKSRFTEGLSNLRALGNAAEVYLLANGTNPTNLSDLDVTVGTARDTIHLIAGKWSYLIDVGANTIYATIFGQATSDSARVDANYNIPQKIYYCKSYVSGGTGEKVCRSFSNNCATPITNLGNCSTYKCCRL